MRLVADKQTKDIMLKYKQRKGNSLIVAKRIGLLSESMRELFLKLDI